MSLGASRAGQEPRSICWIFMEIQLNTTDWRGGEYTTMHPHAWPHRNLGSVLGTTFSLPLDCVIGDFMAFNTTFMQISLQPLKPCPPSLILGVSLFLWNLILRLPYHPWHPNSSNSIRQTKLHLFFQSSSWPFTLQYCQLLCYLPHHPEVILDFSHTCSCPSKLLPNAAYPFSTILSS